MKTEMLAVLEKTLCRHIVAAQDRGVRPVSAKYDYAIGVQNTGGACLTMMIIGIDYATFCRNGGDLIGDAARALGILRTEVEALNAGWEHWKQKKIGLSMADVDLVLLGRKLSDAYTVRT